MNKRPTSEVTDGVVELRPHTPATLDPLLRWKNDIEIQRLSSDETHTFTRAEVAAKLEHLDWLQRRHRPPRDRARRPRGTHRVPPSGAHRTAPPTVPGPGIVIGERELWGRGYGHLAVVQAVDHAFDVLDLDRITAEVFADNPRSARLLDGVGFVREGVMRESIHRDGQRVDELIFGLLRHEWTRART